MATINGDFKVKRRTSASGGSGLSGISLQVGGLLSHEVDNIFYVGTGTPDGSGVAPILTPIGGKGAFVDLSSAQSMAGVKTFVNSPVIPDATADNQPASRGQMNTADALKANIASPTFTGSPAAPTPAAQNNSTLLATTAYVVNAITAFLFAVGGGPTRSLLSRLTDLKSSADAGVGGGNNNDPTLLQNLANYGTNATARARIGYAFMAPDTIVAQSSATAAATEITGIRRNSFTNSAVPGGAMIWEITGRCEWPTLRSDDASLFGGAPTGGSPPSYNVGKPLYPRGVIVNAAWNGSNAIPFTLGCVGFGKDLWFVPNSADQDAYSPVVQVRKTVTYEGGDASSQHSNLRISCQLGDSALGAPSGTTVLGHGVASDAGPSFTVGDGVTAKETAANITMDVFSNSPNGAAQVGLLVQTTVNLSARGGTHEGFAGNIVIKDQTAAPSAIGTPSGLIGFEFDISTSCLDTVKGRRLIDCIVKEETQRTDPVRYVNSDTEVTDGILMRISRKNFSDSVVHLTSGFRTSTVVPATSLAGTGDIRTCFTTDGSSWAGINNSSQKVIATINGAKTGGQTSIAINQAAAGNIVIGGMQYDPDASSVNDTLGRLCKGMIMLHVPAGGGTSKMAYGTSITNISGGNISFTPGLLTGGVADGDTVIFYMPHATGYLSEAFFTKNALQITSQFGNELTVTDGVNGIGGVTLGAPATGMMGRGTANAENGLFQNGNLVQGCVGGALPLSTRYVRTMMANGAAPINQAGAADRMEIYPFTPQYDTTAVKLGINVITAVASATAKIVVYASSVVAATRGNPDALIIETGTLDCSATGAVETTFTTTSAYGSSSTFTFKAGVQYWFGVRYNSTQTLSAWQPYTTPDVGATAATLTITIYKVLRRTLTYATAAPTAWGYVPGDAAGGSSAPAIWIKVN